MNAQIDLEPIHCCNCSMVFAMDADFTRRRREDGKSFHCPNGHEQSFTESKVKRLERELNAAKMREQSERDQRLAAESERDNLKNRAAKGVCPCCKRHFVKLEKHMATKHPNFSK